MIRISTAKAPSTPREEIRSWRPWRLGGWFLLLSALLAVSCGGEQTARRDRARRGARAQALRGGHADQDRGRCDRQGREVSDQDTNGDGAPDVRKVFVRITRPGGATELVMVCREIDLNHDGVKDVVRYYTDEARPLREEADRDFDGRIDSVNFFENGIVVRREIDQNHDGRVDTWSYLERGVITRGERDANGDGRKDHWEYFENGRVIRVGEDLDGDGRVDRWFRNAAAKAAEAPRPEASGDGGAAPDADAGAAPEEG